MEFTVRWTLTVKPLEKQHVAVLYVNTLLGGKCQVHHKYGLVVITLEGHRTRWYHVSEALHGDSRDGHERHWLGAAACGPIASYLRTSDSRTTSRWFQKAQSSYRPSWMSYTPDVQRSVWRLLTIWKQSTCDQKAWLPVENGRSWGLE